MKIHIYTDIDTLFGRAVRLWMDVLLQGGHDVEYIDLGTTPEGALPDTGPCDVNLLICGIYAFARFGIQGLPEHGKNVLWMLDPLTTDPLATVHGHKALLFDAFASKLDAVMAMDEPIESYLRKNYPALAVSRIPYMVAEKNIRVPAPEAGRTGNVIFMGNTSPNRQRAEELFDEAGVMVDFVWRGLWGKERDQRLAQARIALCIHADGNHVYFDQFRTLEAWGAGTVVIAEETSGIASHGIEPGVHLVMSTLDAMPGACAELLQDAPARQRMITASQQLLRENFSTQRWKPHMLALIESLR